MGSVVAACSLGGLPPERPAGVRSCAEAFTVVPQLCPGARSNGCVTNIPCDGFAHCDGCPRGLACAGGDTLVGYPHLSIDALEASCDAGLRSDASVRDANVDH
jgi:hypothetical protein